MEGPHNTELTRPSAVERSLEELKHLLEGNSCTLGDCRTHSDEDQGDQCTELMANMTALHQKVQELADLNTELRRQEQSVTVREQKDLMEILKESHKRRIQQITVFLQDMKEAERRSYAELLATIPTCQKK